MLALPNLISSTTTYAEPSLAVLGLGLFTVAHPVSVPSPESSRVVNADSVNLLDLEASGLELVDSPTKGSRSIGAREDVLVHEKTPVEVLVLPSLAETSILKEEDTIIIEHVVDLGEEAKEVTDTNVLGHLETGNLLVATSGNRDVTVIGADNLALLLGDTDLAHSSISPGSLVTTKSNAGDIGAVVLTGKASQGTPAAANVEHAVALS